MQIDMHFYGVYALCRAAGINEKYAKIIAFSSQFVDDARGDDTLVFKTEKTAILPTMTSHKPLDLKNTIEEDQWRVWVVFHFLPGNEKNARNFEQKMICQKDSKPAKEILKHALLFKKEDIGPYLCGITAHVYADTFAHYGFTGLNSPMNKVRDGSIITYEINKNTKKRNKKRMIGFFERLISAVAETVAIGHGAVATLPDKPYLKWEYRYEKGKRKKVKRTNWKDYHLACQKLYEHFRKFLENNPGKGDLQKAEEWKGISEEIKSLLKTEGSSKTRIKHWKKGISTNMLFNASKKDRKIIYNKKEWYIPLKEKKIMSKRNIEKTNLNLFYKAAWKYRNFVLYELLPERGLLVK